MAGHNYEVIVGGRTLVESGTSASAPVFAAFVSLVNSARLEAGQAPLGFLNPTLYSLGGAGEFYNDVVSGENNCAAGQISQICCTEGFKAAKGWDPLTGWGSVDFTKFKAKFGPMAPTPTPTPAPKPTPAPAPAPTPAPTVDCFSVEDKAGCSAKASAGCQWCQYSGYGFCDERSVACPKDSAKVLALFARRGAMGRVAAVVKAEVEEDAVAVLAALVAGVKELAADDE